MNKTLQRINQNGEIILNNQLVFGQHWIEAEKVIDNDQETAATDGQKIYYNESFVADLNWNQLHTLSLHETLHIALADHLRMKGKDRELWNAACDYVNNHLQIQMGCEPIKDWLLDSSYFGKSKEEVYSLLKDKSKQEQDSIKQQSKQSAGQFDEPKDKKGNTLLSEEEKEEAKKEASSKLASGIRATQKVAENLKEQTKSDDPKVRQRAKDRLKEIGSDVFEQFGIQLQDIIDTKIPWEETLHRFINTALSQDDYSWQQADEEMRVASGFYVPSLENEKLENIALVIDCSGSQSAIEKQIASEAFNCMEALGLDSLDVFYVSDILHEKQTIKSPNDIKYVRGGGTDFRSFFNGENEFTKGNYNGCIFITDGYVAHLDKWNLPHCDILWVLTTHSSLFERYVPFGECIHYHK